MRWTVHLGGGPRRVNHAAVAVYDRIFSFGGYCTGDNYLDPLPMDIFVLNTHTYRWSAVPTPDPETYDPISSNWPHQRYGHTVVAWQSNVILFGGRSDHNLCNNVYVLDTDTMKWTKHVLSNAPLPRDGHAACVIDNCMYIFGGYIESLTLFSSDIIRLVLPEMRWEDVKVRGESPAFRDFHTATAVGKRMYVFGGRCCTNILHITGDEFYCNTLYYLDTDTCEWKSIVPVGPDTPSGRRSHSAINVNDNLMIFGGYNSQTNDHKNDLWLFDTALNNWVELHPKGKKPEPRRRQAICLVGTKLFLFGGTSPYHGPPIQYTLRQLALMPEFFQNTDVKLMDHNDLFVLDLNPSLRTLCLEAVMRDERLLWELEHLPAVIKDELYHMSTNNTISQPLKTLTSGWVD